MNRKFYTRLGMMIASVIFFVAMAVRGADTSITDSVEKAQDISTLTYLALSALVPIFASVIANFFKINDSDSKWIKVVKKTVNLLAINVSRNAGQ